MPVLDANTAAVPSIRLPLSCLAIALFGVTSPRAWAEELAPLAPGKFAVATTNLEVRPQADAKAMFDFMNGRTTDAGAAYLTDILVHPGEVPTVQLDVPADPKRFGSLAGKRLPLVLLVVYPTAPGNSRPDYVYPYTETGDRTFSRMQRPGEKPILPDPAVKYPVIVLSGGYNTHALWHLHHLKTLAAHGYIVVDVFHGDGRSGSLVTNLSLRGLGVRAALDWLLRDSAFGPVVDEERIGAIGESAGGHTVLAALGGIDPSGRVPPLGDPRVKAAVGVVPFVGQSIGIWPWAIDAWHFGEDFAGLNRVSRPFLAIYAGKDRSVAPAGVEAGVRALSGPTIAVRLDDEGHLLSAAAHADAHAWEVVFFNAWLRGDAEARRQLEAGTSVRGGTADRVAHRAQRATASR